MIWENPFLIKNYEGNVSADAFLDLFNISVLDVITEEFFCSTNYISSSPGAGKTTLFKAFSPEILKLFKEEVYQKRYNKMFRYLTKRKLVAGDNVRLISSYISCAGNYGLLENILEEREGEWIFSSLINFRIIIAMLRSIVEMEMWKDREELERISFVSLPEEMFAMADVISNGKKMYMWVCEQEKKLCRYLDGNIIEKPQKQTWQMTLSALKIFEPSNILIDGEQKYACTLIIFDDFHQLTYKQKEFIVQSLYLIRPRIACWIGQRLVGLKAEQIISLDGSIGREYQKSIILDSFWEKNTGKYRNAIKDIANRRIRWAEISGVDKFSTCVSNSISGEMDNKIEEGICDIRNIIENVHYAPMKYGLIIKDIEEGNYTKFERAKRYECLVIKLRREEYGQMEFYLGEVESVKEFHSLYASWEKVAEYYFCRKYNVPYYYGEERLIEISASNIEQYLYFASGLFERSRAAFLRDRRGKKNYKLSAFDQSRYLDEAVKKRWEDINYRYAEAERVQKILKNVGVLCQRIADGERNSYVGGTITGIGIPLREINDVLSKGRDCEILELLIKCVSDRYLEKRFVEHGEKYVIFYLNRWLCVYFHLPLAYGGWKAMKIERAAKLLDEKFAIEDF